MGSSQFTEPFFFSFFLLSNLENEERLKRYTTISNEQLDPKMKQIGLIWRTKNETEAYHQKPLESSEELFLHLLILEPNTMALVQCKTYHINNGLGLGLLWEFCNFYTNEART